MNKEIIKLLDYYITSNEVPLLEDFIFGNDIPSSVVIPADIAVSELTGHYEGEDYVAPKWYNDIISNDNIKILVIDKIDSISKEKQFKFVELLEYRKISTFELPKNCVIIVTAKIINKDTINEEIFSLVAHIR